MKYLNDRPLKISELNSIILELTLGRARMLLVIPEVGESPELVFFRGADGVTSQKNQDEISYEIDAIEGSPVELYIDAGGRKISCQADYFDVKQVPGADFAVISGTLGEEKTIVVSAGN